MEADVWGMLYKIVDKKLNRCLPGTLMVGKEVELADKLFPRCPNVRWDEVPVTGPKGFPADLSSEDHTQAELFKTGSLAVRFWV